MAEYSITFAHSARKELESLEATLVQRIFPTIEALAKELPEHVVMNDGVRIKVTYD